MQRICPRQPIALKKSSSSCSAKRATVGARSVKSGQSCWFIGYKKHTLRLWIGLPERPVLLVPLISWAAPANRCDVLFLEPSLRLCQKLFHFLPDLVVADLAYLGPQMQRRVREQLHVGILTPLRRDLICLKALNPV